MFKIFLFFLIFVCSLSNAAITEQSITNEQNQAIFRVFSENRIQAFNVHRINAPTLQFQLRGTQVEKIDAKATSNWTLTLGQGHIELFSIATTNSNVSRFDLIWQIGSAASNSGRELCFEYAHNGASWYNAYQSNNASWPMDTSRTFPKQQFNHVLDYPRELSQDWPLIPHVGQDHIGVLEQLFVNSDGFAILLDPLQPLFIERIAKNGSGEAMLCFSVANVDPYMSSNNDLTYLDIKLHLFSSSNIRTVLDYVVHQSGLIPKPTVPSDSKLIQQPTWFTFDIHDHHDQHHNNSAEALAARIKSHVFSTKAFLMLYDVAYGLADFDEFTTNQSALFTSRINHLKASGFDIGLFMWDITVDHNHPEHDEPIRPNAIDNYGNIDFSNPTAVDLFKNKLTAFKVAMKLDLYVICAQGSAIKSIGKLNDPTVQKYPSQLATKFIETANQIGGPLVVEHGFKTQHIPAWVRLTDYRFTPFDITVKQLVANVLSVSMAGYSYIMPNSAGGFVFYQPDYELYIRWVQALTLMPSMSFIQTPWWYNETEIEITKKMLALHSEHAPTLIALGQKRIETGSPIIRPMWYHAPDDPKAYGIGDQFMVGEDLVVTPVLVEGIRERQVYLPTGTWIDQHGKSFDGPGEFKIPTPLEELAYFKRKV